MKHHEPGANVVGVDVGEIKKGCHTDALRNGQYREQLSTLVAEEVTARCRRLKASMI